MASLRSRSGWILAWGMLCGCGFAAVGAATARNQEIMCLGRDAGYMASRLRGGVRDCTVEVNL